MKRRILFLTDRYVAHYPELHPPLNRDLVVAGAVLHDIGRVREFDDALPSIPVPFTSAYWGSLAGYESREWAKPGARAKKRYGVSGNSFVAYS